MPSSLKEEILAQFKSIHAFCKAHPELCRGAVYQTVSGQYPGNAEKYAGRIRRALAGPEGPAASIPPITPTKEALTQVLLDIRCMNCRRINRRECLACRDQTSTEASQLYDRLFANS